MIAASAFNGIKSVGTDAAGSMSSGISSSQVVGKDANGLPIVTGSLSGVSDDTISNRRDAKELREQAASQFAFGVFLAASTVALQLLHNRHDKKREKKAIDAKETQELTKTMLGTFDSFLLSASEQYLAKKSEATLS
jgi:hypothetical protein